MSKEKVWIGLTDEDRQRVFESLPGGLEGFLKGWGWLHFAKAIEEICKEKNAGTMPDLLEQAQKAAIERGNALIQIGDVLARTPRDKYPH